MEFLLLLDSPESLQSRPFKACQITLPNLLARQDPLTCSGYQPAYD